MEDFDQNNILQNNEEIDGLFQNNNDFNQQEYPKLSEDIGHFIAPSPYANKPSVSENLQLDPYSKQRIVMGSPLPFQPNTPNHLNNNQFPLFQNESGTDLFNKEPLNSFFGQNNNSQNNSGSQNNLNNGELFPEIDNYMGEDEEEDKQDDHDHDDNLLHLPQHHRPNVNNIFQNSPLLPKHPIQDFSPLLKHNIIQPSQIQLNNNNNEHNTFLNRNGNFRRLSEDLMKLQCNSSNSSNKNNNFNINNNQINSPKKKQVKTLFKGRKKAAQQQQQQQQEQQQQQQSLDMQNSKQQLQTQNQNSKKNSKSNTKQKQKQQQQEQQQQNKLQSQQEQQNNNQFQQQNLDLQNNNNKLQQFQFPFPPSQSNVFPFPNPTVEQQQLLLQNLQQQQNKFLNGQQQQQQQQSLSADNLNTTQNGYNNRSQNITPSTVSKFTPYLGNNQINTNSISTPQADIDEDPNQNQRSQRGLKRLSIKVNNIVSDLGNTTYKEVANKLIEELEEQHSLGNDTEQKDEQNVKRRVYDALNVLIAADVLKKNGKEVLSNSNKILQGKNNKPQLQKQKKELEDKITQYKKIVDSKKLKVKDLLQKYLAIKNLQQRNLKELNGNDDSLEALEDCDLNLKQEESDQQNTTNNSSQQLQIKQEEISNKNTPSSVQQYPKNNDQTQKSDSLLQKRKRSNEQNSYFSVHEFKKSGQIEINSNEKFHFPLIALTVQEQNLQLIRNKDHKSLKVKSQKEFQIYGDLDLVILMGFHKKKYQQAIQLIQQTKLEKYIDFQWED